MSTNAMYAAPATPAAAAIALIVNHVMHNGRQPAAGTAEGPDR